MKTKKCRSCNYCKRVYRKFRYGFGYGIEFSKAYYCTACKKITEPESEPCENFCRKKRRETDLSPQRFDEAEEAIRFISKSLKDE